MRRFEFELREGQGYSIFDRTWTHTRPIAWTYEVHVAEAICNALNKEDRNEPATTASPSERRAP